MHFQNAYHELNMSQLEQYEKEFFKNYIKPQNSISNFSTINDKINKELEEIANEEEMKLKNPKEEYSPDKINFHRIPDSGVLFHPQNKGILNRYALTGEEVKNSIKKRVEDLDNAYQGKFNLIDHQNLINQAKILLKSAKKQISKQRFVLDLSNDETFQFILMIAQFLNEGFSETACIAFQNFDQLVDKDSNLQATISYATNHNKGSKNNIQFFTRFAYTLLINLQCYNFIQFASRCDKFLFKNYYADAPMRDPFISKLFAEVVQKAEQLEMVGKLDYLAFEKKIPPYSQPVPTHKFINRVSQTIDNYLNSLRKWLLLDIDIIETERYKNSIIKILRLFVDLFLTLHSGEIVKISVINDVFNSIGNQNITDPDFSTFKHIIHSSRGWNAIIQLFNNKLLHKVILWGIISKPVKTVPNPLYYHIPDLCKEISNKFELFDHSTLPITYDELKAFTNE